MKGTYMNGRFYYKGKNGILLPAVTTILKATQPLESVTALSNWGLLNNRSQTKNRSDLYIQTELNISFFCIESPHL
ncbi:hypothetical protein NDA07_24430 [Microcoleus vaginatus DQ-U2]|nr:hypothetical protein [Microcoleus sp. FACHB-DQ6]